VLVLPQQANSAMANGCVLKSRSGYDAMVLGLLLPRLNGYPIMESSRSFSSLWCETEP